MALRDLMLNGQGTVATGIQIGAAAAVHIERCTIHGSDVYGIIKSNAGEADVFVLDSIIRDNGFTGVQVESGRATIVRSTVSGNAAGGFYLVAGRMTIESSAALANGGSGLAVLSGATARISNSTLTDNSAGINNFGTVETRQNNTVRGNGCCDLSGPNPPTPIGGT